MKVLGVPCPSCHADVGRQCRHVITDTELATSHVARLDFASAQGAGATPKPPLHLLEPRANEQIALALAHGAEKYNRRDYMRTDDHRLPMSDYVGRLRRHIDAWDSGEDTDPDSGLSHIAHIGANAHVLLSGASFADDRNSTP